MATSHEVLRAPEESRSPASSRVVPRWPFRFLQVTLGVTAVLMFGEAVLAGQFMAGEHSTFAMHRELATVAGIAVMVSIVAAVLVWWPGRGPWWPIAATTGLLALMSLQAFAGFRSLTALHVPLGVTVILVTVALTTWAWWKR